MSVGVLAALRLLPDHSGAMWHWLGDAYRNRIVETGREPLFLLLVGLIGSFLMIRFSVRMIRRGVKWWPGNVQPGGVHIHHVVFGQAMMLIGGIGSFAVRGGPVAHNVLAVVFGIGCGLVLDEFALVLHLEDVYWSEQGRQSVDAVILAVSVIGLLLIGQAPLGGYIGGRSYETYVAAAPLLGFVVLCLLKGKVWTGLLGVMVPLLALVGALRLARPASPWARWRYASRPRRMARAERREDRFHRRFMAMKTSVMDAVAGAPTPVSLAKPPPRPTIVDLPPSRLELLLARVLRPLRDPGAAIAVWYLRVATAVNVVTGVVAPFRHRVRAAANGEYVTPFLVSPGFTGAVLAYLLSVSLRRRKRAAWIATTLLATGYLVVIVVTTGALGEARQHPVNWISIGLTLVLLGALLVSRPLFNVRGERGNAALGLLSLVVGAAVAVGVGTLLVYATDQAPPRQWASSLRYAAVRVLTVSGLFDVAGIEVSGWTDVAINVLSVALMLVVLLAFFRAPRGRTRLAPADERRLRALLRVYGRRDSLGYFALRRDKAVCWDPQREAAIVYRVVNGVALASGDPLGPRAAWPGAIGHWLATARRHAWVPAAAYAGAAAAVAYEAAGFRALSAGEEVVVEVRGFAEGYRGGGREALDPQGASLVETDGDPGMAALRRADAVVGNAAGREAEPGGAQAGPVALRRARELVRAAGYTAVFRRQREIGAEEWVRLGQLADAWRRARGVPVGLGRLGDPGDGDCLVAECRDPRGRTCALLGFVPWGEDGLTLDLMRRDRESGRAPVDFLLTELLLGARSGAPPLAGITRVSLNLLARHRRRAREGDRAYAAYRPLRRERYLLYERPAELPRVAAAGALAEGLLTAPRLVTPAEQHTGPTGV
ncbi:phosphatidylglycerol lysyltransferase domain-containing protein [Streptomyces sp.]|uniref:phosphatidylglycerol lysyltransferase domain-containing protein n=1 Tax=Streptomyces sp. TaxID=1931 RepID=UPI002F405A11